MIISQSQTPQLIVCLFIIISMSFKARYLLQYIVLYSNYIIQMINIIEHLWHLQLKKYEIMPTVIKTATNTPKSYFFSSKQSKVLRKKDQTIESAFSTLQTTPNFDHQLLMVKVKTSNTVQYNLILNCQARQWLSESEDNFVIIGLRYKNISNLIYYSFNFGKQDYEANIIMNLCKDTNIWLSPAEQRAMFGQKRQQIHKFCLKLVKNLQVQLGLSHLKLAKIELIVSSNRSFEQFVIVWCNRLMFSENNFYQINYKMYSQVSAIIPKQQQQNKNILKYMEKDQNIYKCKTEQKSYMTQKKQVGPMCWGCGNSDKLQQSKEISNQQVMVLRRKHGLSIMGIFDQYLSVCLSCYEMAGE